MPINLAGLSQGISAISDVSNLVLVSPVSQEGFKPQFDEQALGSSILFDYSTEDTIQLSSEITDHFVEDNVSINDHIAIKPEIVTVRGVVAELNQLITQSPLLDRTAIDKLTLINAYQPELTLTALRAYNQAEQGYRVAVNAKNNVLNTLSSALGRNRNATIESGNLTEGAGSQSKQQIFFTKFYGYWRNRTLFNVQTPWAIFKNMAIQNMQAIQGEDTDTMSDFVITFKALRFAQASFVFSSQFQEGRALDQASLTNDIGTTEGQQATRPLSSRLEGLS